MATTSVEVRFLGNLKKQFTNCGHTCWHGKAGERTAIHSIGGFCVCTTLGVLPPVGSTDRESAICERKPLIIAVLERFESMVVEIAGLLRDTTPNGTRGVKKRKKCRLTAVVQCSC